MVCMMNEFRCSPSSLKQCVELVNNQQTTFTFGLWTSLRTIAEIITDTAPIKLSVEGGRGREDRGREERGEARRRGREGERRGGREGGRREERQGGEEGRREERRREGGRREERRREEEERRRRRRRVEDIYNIYIIEGKERV